MTSYFSRNRATWLAYFLLAFYGYYLNILGPITPFLKDELKLSYTVSSLHFTAFAGGMLIAGLGGHLVIQRIGRWRSLWLGALGMSVSALFLVAGWTPVLTIAACLLMGLIGSLILAIVPSALSDQYGERRSVALSEANVISSISSAAAPLAVGWFVILSGGWRPALGLAALVPLLIRFGLGRVNLPETKAAQPDATRRPGSLPFLYWVYWIAIVLAVSVEFCMVFWSADYLEQVLGLAKAAAAQAVSVFLIGMIIGRLAGSRLVQRFPIDRCVLVSILLACGGFLIYWGAPGALIGIGGLFLTGLGVASLYPLILSLAIGSAGAASVQASARATLASGTAILALPLVLGRLADAVGIRLAYGVVAVLLVGVLLITQFAGRVTRARPETAVVENGTQINTDKHR